MPTRGLSHMTNVGQEYIINDPNGADEFNSTFNYKVGDIVYYNGLTYRFVKAHSAGAWSASDVEATGRYLNMMGLQMWSKQINTGNMNPPYDDFNTIPIGSILLYTAGEPLHAPAMDMPYTVICYNTNLNSGGRVVIVTNETTMAYRYEYEPNVFGEWNIVKGSADTPDFNKHGLDLSNGIMVMGEVHNDKYMRVYKDDPMYEDSYPGLAYNTVNVIEGEQFYVGGHVFGVAVYNVIFADNENRPIAKFGSGADGSAYSDTVYYENAYLVPKGAVKMYVTYAHKLSTTTDGNEKPFFIYKLGVKTGKAIVDTSSCTFGIKQALLYTNGQPVTQNDYNWIKIPVSANDVFEIDGMLAGTSVSDALFLNSNGGVVYAGRFNLTNDFHFEKYQVAVPTNTGITHMVLNFARGRHYFSITKITTRGNQLYHENAKLAILGDSRSDIDTFCHSWGIHMKALSGFDSVYIDGIGGTCVTKATPYGGSFVTRAANIPSGTNVIAIYGGINDFANNVPIGTITDSDSSTFYGGLNLLITDLQTRYPAATLLFITPEYVTDVTVNTLGLHAIDYVDAIIAICDKFHIHYRDHYRNCGIDTSNSTQVAAVFPDGVHANALGNMKYARDFAGCINSIFA